MHSFTIEKNETAGSILLPYCFIDQYMNRLSGDAVRLYLYLLRHSSDTDLSLTVSGLAASLSMEEPDILPAFHSLETAGLLAIVWDTSSLPSSIRMLACVPQDSASIFVDEQIKKHAPQLLTPDSTVKVPERRPHTEESFSLYTDDEDAQAVFYVARKYLGRILSPSDVDSILYYREDLQFSWDLIEYLIEYCTSGGHRKFAYIDKVALSWFESHVQTVEDAKAAAKRYSEQYFTIIRAFGIKDRYLAKSEEDILMRWTNQYGFSTDIIVEACKRTIHKTSRASFDYADGILKRWNEQGVRTLEDIKRLDDAFLAKKSEQPTVRETSSPASAKTSQGMQRNYTSSDLEDLERQLLFSQGEQNQ